MELLRPLLKRQPFGRREMPLQEILDNTLDELDPPAWGEPEYDSHLAAACSRLRRKRLRDYCIEDLRIMIGQEIGLEWPVPTALKCLDREPLVDGDLLASLLRVDPGFWVTHSICRDRLHKVLDSMPQLPKELTNAAAEFTRSLPTVGLTKR